MNTINRARYCLTAHVGGYGDCVNAPGHIGQHMDAHGHRFTDAENSAIMAARLSMREAAARKRSMRVHPAGKALAAATEPRNGMLPRVDFRPLDWSGQPVYVLPTRD